MFSDKYREDNLSITPDPSVKRYIKSKITENNNRKAINFNKNGIIAAALSLVLALGVVFVSQPGRNMGVSITEPSFLNTGVTYTEVYGTLSEIFKNNDLAYDIEYSTGTGDFVLYDGIMGSVNPGARPITRDEENGSTKPTDDGTEVNVNSSETNNQVEGVDEADIVKTDGRYIYSLKNGSLTVIDPASGNPKILYSRQVTHHNEAAQSMFVYKNTVAVIVTTYNYNKATTGVRFFCIDGKISPYETAAVEQNGIYADARMIDGTIYLFSNYWIYNSRLEEDSPTTYIPCVDGVPIQARDISVIENTKTPSYLVISAIDIDSGKCTANQAILGGAENVYANTEHLYFTFTDYNRKTMGDTEVFNQETTIVKLGLGKDSITAIATGKVPGCPLNQFSMDEYEGNLRIVTTNNTTTTKGIVYTSDSATSVSGVTETSSTTANGLYVMDDNLKIIGSIENIAKDERVYSVRFMGDTGYFVTFRQTDPLFSVDLSDPKHPTILGELKIPGFSEYLHPFGENLLFGFGKSATDEGSVTGLKISMFDIENPENVTENHVTEIDAAWSEASGNHKAIMVDADKNIIAFVATDNYGICRLYVYGYDQNGFTLRAESVLENRYGYDARFVWIDEHFYLVTLSDITAFSLSTFTETSYLNY
jgi:uncharacterized secreted protein with C-terminal beta-propeller domain